jgi:uncharacterized membrane protein
VHAVSADGSTVVGGYSSRVSPGFAWRWTQATGFEPLPTIPGDDGAQAEDVSEDGRIIVGTSSPPTLSRAFIWSHGAGTLPLDEFLVSRGVDLRGWTLYTASGISADGRTVVGSGVDALGRHGGYVVTIADCPAGFNADGVINTQDFFNFLDAFLLSEDTADFNDDTAINSSDFFDFLNAYFAGGA